MMLQSGDEFFLMRPAGSCRFSRCPATEPDSRWQRRRICLNRWIAGHARRTLFAFVLHVCPIRDDEFRFESSFANWTKV